MVGCLDKLCHFVLIVVAATCLLIMPKDRSTTRKERRQEQQTNYLAGEASRSYRHTPTLRQSLDEIGSVDSDHASGSSSASPPDRVCCKCKPILSRYHDNFTALVHQGSNLKHHKSRNFTPSMQMYNIIGI